MAKYFNKISDFNKQDIITQSSNESETQASFDSLEYDSKITKIDHIDDTNDSVEDTPIKQNDTELISQIAATKDNGSLKSINERLTQLLVLVAQQTEHIDYLNDAFIKSQEKINYLIDVNNHLVENMNNLKSKFENTSQDIIKSKPSVKKNNMNTTVLNQNDNLQLSDIPLNNSVKQLTETFPDAPDELVAAVQSNNYSNESRIHHKGTSNHKTILTTTGNIGNMKKI